MGTSESFMHHPANVRCCRTETLKKANSDEMAIINIESNASDGEIECLRVAFYRHCPVLDYLSKSLTVELEFKTARKNKKLSA